MVTVNYETSPKRKTFKLTIEGHAGQAEKGKDLVCACVSILAYTAAKNVEFLANIGSNPPTIRLEEGDSLIECGVTDSNLYKNIACRLDAVVTGFRILQESYPQYVTVNINGKADKPHI